MLNFLKKKSLNSIKKYFSQFLYNLPKFSDILRLFSKCRNYVQKFEIMFEIPKLCSKIRNYISNLKYCFKL